ncbi:hypothetical protein LBBP_02863 [Leptospira borgpetersenii serovar Ballum]|uniref:Uncharacterized protein n=1 Tax=Leptospira borgpetersenii serovar Ballum TaxID=280505 RepID=A0A0S2ITU8_LEPBO|nr:hypothetical protein LBBP_02863 [Leptospira borgpetersenii serovar Ballum]
MKDRIEQGIAETILSRFDPWISNLRVGLLSEAVQQFHDRTKHLL